ncbi:hypothetical protein [Amycolatopsis pigmentata]|uniref:Immunity protein 53 n=1 Tax=Amycolatopsis pigmentata TaxID=450801 RepID=A0ABW5GAF6_9PSEU
MTTPAHTLNAHLAHCGPDAGAPRPATTASDGAAATMVVRREAVWRALAEAITYDCILTFDPASGWGHWATTIPGQTPLFLGFVQADPELRELPELEGITLAVHRAQADGGFRVTKDDRHPPQWNTWRVSQAWTREGLREVQLRSGLRTALVGR